MDKEENFNFITQNISALYGVGRKIRSLLKRKKIDKISDLLWHFPHGFTDRSNLKELDKLEIGKITTIEVNVLRYNFPRTRNLPNKVFCEDRAGKIEIVFFNSREGYIKKILPLNSRVVISGKIAYYKGKYQITNPSYVVPVKNKEYVNKIIPKYSLTDGISEKIYRKLIEEVVKKLPNLKEWHNSDTLKKLGNKSWKESLLHLHNSKSEYDLKSDHYKRLAYDEILASLLVLSEVRRKIKRVKKKNKNFNDKLSSKLINNFNFNLTKNQKKIISEINQDLKSSSKMFRLLQGDVGSGKTIISFIVSANTIESKYQVALMAPTEILAQQHYNLAKEIFFGTSVNIELISSKTKHSVKSDIIEKLKNGKINFLIGTHALFQKNISFKNLGLVIIDEQHKFGVKQRIELSNKGGVDCDLLLMSATPIPRTLILTFYGDMDVSRLIEKPQNRKSTITLSKPEDKIDEIILFTKKQLKSNHQIFWVCPLIDESKKLDYSAAIKKYHYLDRKFPKKVGLIHGNLTKEEKNIVLKKFLSKSIDILVSTTVIEVGIDFPNANTIIIENSNKFGLSQLHQLRGRVGRGKSQGFCVLLYKKNLSENAKKRIKILKSTNDGFIIAEDDMRLRGFGDVLGYQQSGIKDFKIADPVQHEKLFKLAEIDVKKIEYDKSIFNNYAQLIKLYDKADIINEIDK